MNIRSLSVGVVAVLATTSVLATPVVWVDQASGYYGGNGGGEDTISVDSSYGAISYAGGVVATAGSSFQSFCVETSDTIYLDQLYYAYVDSHILGLNGTTPLSAGAGYLYAHFLAQNLSGYNFTPGSGRAASAGLLQETLWWTMGQVSNPGGAFVTDLYNAGLITSTSGTYSGAYISPVAGNYYETTIGSTIYDVAVLNLGTDSDAQDMLISWNRSAPNLQVPDGGMTVSLLGMAFAGLAFIGRRFGKR